MLSLLLVVLVAIGLLMSRPIREHFADPSQGITDDEWEQIPADRRKMLISQCHFAKEAPTSPESAYINATCRYVQNKVTLKQEFDGYKKETIDEMRPWCDYLKSNYAPVVTNTDPAEKSVSTLSEMLKEDKPINEELTQLQLNLEKKCQQMALGTDDKITSQNQEYWQNLCKSLDKVNGKKSRQLDIAAQQPYNDQEEQDQSEGCLKKRWATQYDNKSEFPDMSQYVKMDEVPCWNCSLP